MAEVHRLEAWIGQQVSLYPREEGPEARTIGLLRTVDERGVILEEPGGIISFYPWMVIFTIRVGEPEEQPTVKVASRGSSPGDSVVAELCLSAAGGAGGIHQVRPQSSLKLSRAT